MARKRAFGSVEYTKHNWNEWNTWYKKNRPRLMHVLPVQYQTDKWYFMLTFIEIFCCNVPCEKLIWFHTSCFRLTSVYLLFKSAIPHPSFGVLLIRGILLPRLYTDDVHAFPIIRRHVDATIIFFIPIFPFFVWALKLVGLFLSIYWQRKMGKNRV